MENQPEYLLQTSYEYGDVYSLFEWSPGESNMLSRLILWLKGAHQSEAWTFYAERFLQKRLSLPISHRRVRIVLPPRKDKSRRHAEFWGDSLGRQLASSVLMPFAEEPSQQTQKQASVQERSKRRYKLREEFTEFVGQNHSDLWVFADDILTTGSTAKAAHLALGSPPHFEVWCLGQRAALLRSLLGSAIKAE